MKHRQDKDFRGGGAPQNKLLRGIKNLLSRNVAILSQLKSGFSLGDTLVAIAVIGALAVILIPIYRTVNPDPNDKLHKKATFIVERIVNEMGSDEYLYPNGGEFNGFSNTSAVQYNKQTHEGSSKFCTLFASHLNLQTGSEVACFEGQKSATSIEGIDWYLPISDFQNGPEIIIADVNGGEGPNCVYDENNCPRPDRFEYMVEPGVKLAVRQVEHFDQTPDPDLHEGVGEDKLAESGERPGINEYSITCNNVTGATVYGGGPGKVNGNYILVAIPSRGYSCNWFTHQVTVKDGNVEDCGLVCTANLKRPTPDGKPEVPEPPPVDPEEPEPGPDPTYCINVEVTGESDKCTVEGAGCGKAPGQYLVTVTPKENGYTAGWTSEKFTIVDKDIDATVECSMGGDDCYNINIVGGENCTITKPQGNCDGDTSKYKNGKYTISVKPNEGFTYNGKTSSDPASGVAVQIQDSDENVTISCEPAAVEATEHTLTIGFSSNDQSYTKAQLWVTIEAKTPEGETSERTVSPVLPPAPMTVSPKYPANTEFKLTDIKSYIWYNNSTEKPGTNGYRNVYLDGKNMWNQTVSGKLDSDKSYMFTLYSGDDVPDLPTKEVILEFQYQFDSCKETNGTLVYANSMLYKVIAIDKATNKEITLPFDASVTYSGGGPCSGTVKVGTSSKCGNADAEIRSVSVGSFSPTSEQTVGGVKYKILSARARNATIDPNVTSCGTGDTPDVPSEEDCSINVVGTGYTKNGAYGTVYLMQGKNQVNSVQLSDLNKYKTTWKNLECRTSYTITTVEGKDDDGNKVTLSASPNSFSQLEKTQTVTVTFTGPSVTKKKYKLTLSGAADGLSNAGGTTCSNSSDHVIVYGAGEYDEGTSAEMTTEWNPNCVLQDTNAKKTFDGWYNNSGTRVSTNRKYTVTMDSDKSFKAKWVVGVPAPTCKPITVRVGVGVVPDGNGSYMLNENANINVTGGEVPNVDITVYAKANMYINGGSTPAASASYTCTIKAGKDYGSCSIDDPSSGYASGANLTVSGSITGSNPRDCATGSVGPY